MKSILALLKTTFFNQITSIFSWYMKRSVAVETVEHDSSFGIESLIEYTPRIMSDPGNDPALSVSVTSEDVERQIKAVTDLITQQLPHICESMKELGDEQAHRRHEETASSGATSLSTGSVSWFEMVTRTLNLAFAPLNTLASPERLTSPGIPPYQRVFSLDDGDERLAANTSSQLNQVVRAINSLTAILQRDVTQTKVLHTQVSNFPGSKDEFNEFEQSLLNHLRPYQHRITEENRLRYFQCFPEDEAIDFWQKLKINTETTLRNELLQFTHESAGEDFKKVSEYKRKQLTYDPSKQTFAELLETLKKVRRNFSVWESTDTNTTRTLLHMKSRCISQGNQNNHTRTVPIPTTDSPNNPDNAFKRDYVCQQQTTRRHHKATSQKIKQN